MGGGLLIITLIFYNVSIGCNLVDHARELAKQRGARPSPLIPVFRGQGHMASTNTMDLKRAVMALN